MNIPKPEELDSPKKKGILYMRKHYPEFAEYILKRYPHINKFNAGIYLYFHNMEHPTCPMCGKPTPFLDESRGFQKYCCGKCANSDPEGIKKRRETNIEKYGTPTPAQNEDIKKKVIATYTANHGGMGNASKEVKVKQQQTMRNLYGTEYALQNDNIKQKMISTNKELYGGMGYASTELSQKIQATNIIKYGAPTVLSNSDVRKKICETNIARYGTPIASQNTEIAEKISNTKSRSFTELHDDILSINKKGETIYYTCKCPHPDCTQCEDKTYIIQAARYCNRKLEGTEPCTRLMPVLKGRNKGTHIELFILSILQECTDMNMIITNSKGIIPPKEIDIYDPIYRLAFECNGCYWYSDEKKSPSYHKNKWKECKNHGIQLISIWEDWVKNKPEIVKSMIKAKYHIYEESIYGRKCLVEAIPPATAAKFYNENHIQGQCRASYHFGLIYNDCIVAAMSFSKMRGCMGSQTSREGQWELVRFCNKLNTQVIGAADKLLKNFIRQMNPRSIVSFSLNDISDGGLYKRLGFIKSGENTTYWYIGQNYRRYHRSNFTKSALIKSGMVPDDLDNWTETEVMMRNGFVRIHDSGQTKWTLNLTN